jgi:hypothetical protein
MVFVLPRSLLESVWRIVVLLGSLPIASPRLLHKNARSEDASLHRALPGFSIPDLGAAVARLVPTANLALQLLVSYVASSLELEALVAPELAQLGIAYVHSPDRRARHGGGLRRPVLFQPRLPPPLRRFAFGRARGGAGRVSLRTLHKFICAAPQLPLLPWWLGPCTRSWRHVAWHPVGNLSATCRELSGA